MSLSLKPVQMGGGDNKFEGSENFIGEYNKLEDDDKKLTSSNCLSK